MGYAQHSCFCIGFLGYDAAVKQGGNRAWKKNPPIAYLNSLFKREVSYTKKLRKIRRSQICYLWYLLFPQFNCILVFSGKHAKKKMIPLHCPLELDFTCEVGHHKCGRYESCVCPCSYHNSMALFILFYFVLFY
jgi:hypothetical protein